MRVGSLFSGIGGLELGLERAGMEVAFQAEYDKQARRVLARHWPDVPRYEDVHDVGRCERDGTGVVVAGDNSDSGRGGKPAQQTKHGDLLGRTRGSVLARRWPDVHRYEDVHDVRDGAAVDVICGGFPCQDYSVAGKRGGLAGDRGALWWEMHRIVAECRPTWVIGENVSGLLSSNGGADFRTIIASLVQLGYGICWATLDSQYFGVAQRRRRLFIVGHSGGVPRPEILAISEGLFGHPAPSREAGEKVAACLGTRSASGHDERGDLIGSGIGITGTAAVAQEHTIPRRLTPVECERLQGFPDGWTAHYDDGTQVADGPRYRMLGNAVTVNVAEWIGRRIMQAEKHDRARIGFDASQDSQENGADYRSNCVGRHNE